MQDRPTLRAGIIGSGFSASFHFASLQTVSSVNIEVIGVYSRTEDNRKRFGNQRGIAAYDSVEELIENSDVVHVCTPPSTHEEFTTKALEMNTNVIVEKPLTGFFGDGTESFSGDTVTKQAALDHALQSVDRFLEAERNSKARIMYAENWVYAPAIQKEREILEKTGAQVLWMHGEEAHSGSHSRTYGYWKFSGGGVLIGKGCHPLTAALYLKRVEGQARTGSPIRPKYVTARTHALTRMETFIDEGHIRADYHDIDDFSAMHIEFEDGTLADIFASDVILGGIHNWLEVATNNHRTVCNINPNNLMQTYNASHKNFEDIYVVEKIGTKEGWSNPAPDEDWVTGYPQEIQAFYEAVAYGTPLQCDSGLAADAVSTIYSAYVSSENLGTRAPIRSYQ